MTRACPLRPAGGHTEGAAVPLQAPVAPVVFVHTHTHASIDN